MIIMKYILDCFEYNQHFATMMNIINYARLTNKEGKFEKHHIVPRCWFRLKNITIDNSKENLVNLTVEQHRKVHKLAVLCCKNDIKSSLQYASNAMNREEEFGEKNPFYGKRHTEEWKQKQSEFQKQRKHTITEIEKMIQSKIGKPSKLKGRTLSEETRIKISQSCKGRIPWNKKKKEG